MVSVHLPYQVSSAFNCCSEIRCSQRSAGAEGLKQAGCSRSPSLDSFNNFRRLMLLAPEKPSGGIQQRQRIRCKDASQENQHNVPYKKWRSKTYRQQPPNGNGSLPKSASEDKGASVVARPRRIILVRHGQSIGNIDESSYTRIPDSKIPLTEEGWHQAVRCGEKIRHLIESDGGDDWKVYFYVSPYKRTLQTLRGIGTAFERYRIAGVREEPRLREQDFGNFQDREKMRVEKEVRIRYGRFFYRFPNGESASDVYDRITAFRETLRSDIDVGRFQQSPADTRHMNLVVVSHGLTLRVFLTRWYKWSVKQFEGLYNFGNTDMMVMELGPGGRYSLLMHHTLEELTAFGMTDEMIADQEWQMHAKPGDLNDNWFTSGSSFFSHFDDMENGLPYKDVPADVVKEKLPAESSFED